MTRPLFPDPTGTQQAAAPPCAFCGSRDTRLLSQFGGQLSVAQCWCNRCRTGFEYLKWEERDGRPDRGDRPAVE